MNFGDNDAFIREIVLNVSRSMEVFLFFVACFIETLTQTEKKPKKKIIIICRNYEFYFTFLA